MGNDKSLAGKGFPPDSDRSLASRVSPAEDLSPSAGYERQCGAGSCASLAIGPPPATTAEPKVPVVDAVCAT